MKKTLYYVLLIFLVILGLLLVIKNPEIVEFNYLFIQWEQKFGLILLAMFALGIVTGAFLVWLSLIKEKISSRGIKKQLVKTEKEVENLRALPIRDDI